MTETILSDSAEATRAHAANLAARAAPGMVILLQGELGAGKTEWVKGFAAALGYVGGVTSPTFSLLHEYSGGRLPIFHWDLYRLPAKTDWKELELPDHLPGPGVTLIEWPDRYPGPWPEGCWEVTLQHLANDHRSITVSLHG